MPNNKLSDDDDDTDCKWKAVSCDQVWLCEQHGALALNFNNHTVPLVDLLPPMMQIKCAAYLLSAAMLDPGDLSRLPQWPHIRADLRTLGQKILDTLPAD